MTTDGKPVILWFRNDLRLQDNPALEHAAATGRPIVPVYILDAHYDRTPGAASLWWLDKSLRALAASIEGRGGRLILRRGDAEIQLRHLIEETGADTIFMNRSFTPQGFARDADIAHALKAGGGECKGYNGSLLCRPGGVMTGSGGPYKVFTPFYRALMEAAEPPPHTLGPREIATPKGLDSERIEDWGLHPTDPDWSKAFDWTPGEDGAHAALATFVDTALKTYSIGRDHPAEVGGSRLSPHLHFGEISPWRAVLAARNSTAPVEEIETFTKELSWRDFSAQLLHHFPFIPERAFRPEFDNTEWRRDAKGLKAWKTGQTGYPIVDAGMRQLWATGWMHNRVRMVAASFLVKHLLIDWREGEDWFWDTLVDADLANNVQNWQWVAGSGADASPYFRIFNPIGQGERFDASGDYVRRWVPELAALPAKWIHAPWTAPKDVLAQARVGLGVDYPRPIVDHAEARARALNALKTAAHSKYDDEA